MLKNIISYIEVIIVKRFMNKDKQNFYIIE